MTRRLVLAFLALTAFVLAVLEIPLGLSVAQSEEDQLIADIQRDAFALASFSEDVMEGTGTTDLEVVADEYQARTGARVVFVAADGTVLADSDPLPGSDPGRSFAGREEIDAALDGRVVAGARASASLGTDLVYAAVPVASGGEVHGAVRVSYPREEVDERIRRYWWALVGVAALALLAAAGLGTAIGRWAAKPLLELESSSAALGGGDLTVRAPTGAGPREVRSLATSFNDMADRLEQLVGAQEAFVADASHQLRTPLTALRLRIENVLEGDRPEEATTDLEAALSETARLSRLVDGLLALARADRVSGLATADELSLDGVLAERVEVWAAVAAEQGVDIAASPTDVVVLAGADRLIQVLDNLVANALDALAPRGRGRVELRAAVEDGRGVLHVVDDGPGLPEQERERAFDRFWRASGPRADRELGGTGLGLAICRKLVAVDGGTIDLLEAPGGGIDAAVRYTLAGGPERPARPRDDAGPAAATPG